MAVTIYTSLPEEIKRLNTSGAPSIGSTVFQNPGLIGISYTCSCVKPGKAADTSQETISSQDTQQPYFSLTPFTHALRRCSIVSSISTRIIISPSSVPPSCTDVLLITPCCASIGCRLGGNSGNVARHASVRPSSTVCATLPGRVRAPARRPGSFLRPPGGCPAGSGSACVPGCPPPHARAWRAA